MKIVFVHGWGFGPSVWDRMAPQLSGHECLFPNLGFIGRGDADISLPEDAILVGHSLGAMRALKHRPEKVRGFVSIGGFDCFSAHIPLQDIAGMERHLATNPSAQMRGFYRACGLDEAPPIEDFNTAQLFAGLEWLKDEDQRAALSSLTCPVMALAAEDDKVVPSSMSQSIWSRYDLRMIQEGGHVLPLTQPDWCAQQLKDFMNAF